MIRQFSIQTIYDSKGRAWSIESTLAIITEFTEWFDQATAAGGDALAVLYASALWDACEDQAKAYGVTQPEFAGLITNDFISALWQSLEPFSTELAAMGAAYRSA